MMMEKRDAGSWKLDTGCWMRVAGSKMKDSKELLVHTSVKKHRRVHRSTREFAIVCESP